MSEENKAEEFFAPPDMPQKDLAVYAMASTARFVGELKWQDIRVTHIWPDFSDKAGMTRMFEGVDYRHRFALSCRRIQQNNSFFTKYDANRKIPLLASIWFGKDIRYLGAIIENEQYLTPRDITSDFLHLREFPPFNHIPRKDLGIDLNWDFLSTPAEIFNKPNTPELAAFWSATRLYSSGLAMIETDAEIAFFMLISALESIAANIEVPENELFDKATFDDLDRIKTFDAKIYKRIKSRLFQVQRRICWLCSRYLNQNYFAGGEAKNPYANPNPASFPQIIKDAYQIRSKYAHTGDEFGLLVEPSRLLSEEVLVGDTTWFSGNGMVKTLPKGSITLLGLERMVRFVCLAFCHEKIISLNEKLTPANPPLFEL